MALIENPAATPTVDQAFAHCRKIALGHYENFSIATWLLPQSLRSHLFALYAYCRGVDDLGDEADGDRLALLDEWEADLKRCFSGTSRDIRFVALQETVRTFDLPIEPFRDLVEANRRDQRINRYETFDELLDYCAYSANPVGRLVLALFGYRDEERRRLSDAACTALQLTNFWQDVSLDLKKGRIYIPGEDMRRFGCGEDDLMAAGATEPFRRLMTFEVSRTRSYFKEGLRLLPLVPVRLRFALKLFALGGIATLTKIERLNYDTISRRPMISPAGKVLLAMRAALPLGVRAR